MNTIKITKACIGVDIKVNGEQLSPMRSQSYRNHSPDGFNVGYCGSGPAQAALGILLHVTTPELAMKWYQDFKYDFVSLWKVGQTYEVDIAAWLKERA